MMKLDGSLATLFLEQKKKVQAKKDEKDRLRKEKVLVRDYKIKVWGCFYQVSKCLLSIIVVLLRWFGILYLKIYVIVLVFQFLNHVLKLIFLD